MSRPIKLTEEMVKAVQAEFLGKLSGAKMFDGKLSYDKTFSYEKGSRKASLVFTPEAYAKMTMLVQSFSTEVAWHGVVYRDEQDSSRFNVTDILVYPQEVTGGTVDMDEVGYGQWIDKGIVDNDERMNHLYFQGHSHVNMGVSPSSTDLGHQESVLKAQRNDKFYIFMITNKKFDTWIRIFDLKENVCYEKEDIELMIGEDGVDLNQFIEDAKKMVKTRTYTPKSTKLGTYGGWAGTQQRVPTPRVVYQDDVDYGAYWAEMCDHK